MASRIASQQCGGMPATLTSRPATLASASTSPSRSGWPRRSASPSASRGTDTPIHCDVSARAPLSSLRICGRGLVAASSAAAAGSQSPTAITALGLSPRATATASATAQHPNSSAAGMLDRVGSGVPVPPVAPTAASLSAFVIP
eukprot:4009557-Pleurochrysis_carterae.AAC.2